MTLGIVSPLLTFSLARGGGRCIFVWIIRSLLACVCQLSNLQASCLVAVKSADQPITGRILLQPYCVGREPQAIRRPSCLSASLLSGTHFSRKSASILRLQFQSEFIRACVTNYVELRASSKAWAEELPLLNYLRRALSATVNLTSWSTAASVVSKILRI